MNKIVYYLSGYSVDQNLPNNPMSENIFERHILKVNEFVECWEFLNNIL